MGIEPQEVSFQCPYCWETISMVFDLTASSDPFIEDCEVCCHPIQVEYSVDPEIESITVFPKKAQ